MDSLLAAEVLNVARAVNAPEHIAVRIALEIHPHDAMFHTTFPSSYIRSGAQAFKAISAAMMLSQKTDVGSILDFGCGHGRVGRWLRAAYPGANITGAEIMPSAVEFYSNLASAKGWQTAPNVRAVDTDEHFDLIWAGSVLTHLMEKDADMMIEKFRNWLAPGGLAVFSTHGRLAPRVFLNAPPKRIDFSDLRKAIAVFEDGLYGYTNYLNEQNYGLSFTPMDWLLSKIRPFGRIVCTSEGGWNGFQDVTAFQLLT